MESSTRSAVNASIHIRLYFNFLALQSIPFHFMRLILMSCLSYSMNWERLLPKLSEDIMTNFQILWQIFRLDNRCSRWLYLQGSRKGEDYIKNKTEEAATLHGSKTYSNFFGTSEATLQKIWWRSIDYTRKAVDFCYIRYAPFHEGWKVESITYSFWSAEIPETGI